MSDADKADRKAVKVLKGVSIYKVEGSRNWQVRVWDSERQKYIVRSTGEKSRIEARTAAVDFARTIFQNRDPVERRFSFRLFGLKAVAKGRRLVADGERNLGTVKAMEWAIQNEEWSLLRTFGNRDVRKINTRDFTDYMTELGKKRPDFSSSTKNSIMAAFRNVLKAARDEGVIDVLPDTPRSKQVDNPRPFFRFHPLVAKEQDAYRKLLKAAREMAEEGVVVRGIKVTYELYDIIVFLTQSFVRPLVLELYAIKHEDIAVFKDPVRLRVVIRNGKTGYREASTMPEAVSIYEAIRRRYPSQSR